MSVELLLKIIATELGMMLLMGISGIFIKLFQLKKEGKW